MLALFSVKLSPITAFIFFANFHQTNHADTNHRQRTACCICASCLFWQNSIASYLRGLISKAIHICCTEQLKGKFITELYNKNVSKENLYSASEYTQHIKWIGWVNKIKIWKRLLTVKYNPLFSALIRSWKAADREGLFTRSNKRNKAPAGVAQQFWTWPPIESEQQPPPAPLSHAASRKERS